MKTIYHLGKKHFKNLINFIVKHQQVILTIMATFHGITAVLCSRFSLS